MDPLPSHSIAFHRAATTTPAAIFQQYYADSNNSSALSRLNNTWDRPPPPVPDAKLRLMCSYGGHIIPRPHDKSLCYVGGDTRFVMVERQSSISDVHTRLSHTLLNGHNFTLKYKIPGEHLDSLVSVTTDADLVNMIEEYDRTLLAYSPLKPSHLRLFLFQAKLETAASVGSLLDYDHRSETWFVDTSINAGLLSRGLSDSSAVHNLLELDNIQKNDACENLEAQNESLDKNAILEVHSPMADAPIVETTSSFDSSISSQSMANLPPVTVKLDDNHMTGAFQDQILGLDEQFSYMHVAANAQSMDDGFQLAANTAAAPALATEIGGTDTISSGSLVKSAAANGERYSPVMFGDEKSDHGAPTRLRKPPLPLLLIQRKIGDDYSLPSPDSTRLGGYNLPSPDSVASDSSAASAVSLSKHMIYQHTTPVTSGETGAPFTVFDPKNNIIEPNSQIQMQQGQDSVVIPAPQQNQQQQPEFSPAITEYIQHTTTGPVTVPSYYPMYAPPSQQPLRQQMDQKYQIYLIPIPQTQPYNMTLQSNIADAASVASSRTVTPPNTTTLSSLTAYKEASVYITAVPATPRFFQVPSSQFQQQYYGLSQVPPSPTLAAVSAANANLSYEYSPAPSLPSQYQTRTPITTAVLVSQASAQFATENATS